MSVMTAASVCGSSFEGDCGFFGVVAEAAEKAEWISCCFFPDGVWGRSAEGFLRRRVCGVAGLLLDLSSEIISACCSTS